MQNDKQYPGPPGDESGHRSPYEREDPDSVARYYRQPPYQPQPVRRGGWPWWGTLLIGCALGLIILCGVWIWVFSKMFSVSREAFEEEPAPPAGMHTGTQLSWRVLLKFDRRTDALAAWRDRTLHVGEFTGDGVLDLLVVRESDRLFRPRADLVVVELSGVRQEVPLPRDVFSYKAVPYDRNGDGRDEIALLTWGNEARVITAEGRVVAGLQASQQMPDCVEPADIDGDGHAELPCMMLNGSEILFYGVNGILIWQKPVGNNGYGHCTGDIDGDGKDELIDYSEDRPVAYGLDQPEQPIHAIESKLMNLYCRDVTGDGQDELVEPALGWYDPASERFTSISWPQLDAHYGVTACADFIDVEVIDIDRDGRREVVTTGNPYVGFAVEGTGLHAFDQSGKKVYHEELGEYVYNITVVTDADGQEHLVAHTQSRLLIHP